MHQIFMVGPGGYRSFKHSGEVYLYTPDRGCILWLDQGGGGGVVLPGGNKWSEHSGGVHLL
jgi:hypothetical protein